MKNSLLFLSAICLFIMQSACAVGNAHRYHDTIADLNVAGTIAIAVTTHDQREYIISGDKKSNFVGLSRGGFGNPFDVTTETGESLASDMTKSLVNSLSKKGFKPVSVLVNPKDDQQTIIDKLRKVNAERLFLLTLIEWKSDTYQNTALHFDIKATVYDSTGKTLGEKELKGTDDLGGSALNPPGHAKKAVPKAFKEKIQSLLNSNEIISALQ